MSKFNSLTGSNINNRKKIAVGFAVIILLLIIGSAFAVRKAYESNLQPLSSSDKGIVVTIEPGSAPGQIAEELKAKGVIKSDWALEWYVRNHNLRDKLKAGTYLFKPSQSVSEIVNQLAEGKVATDLVTILPGKRIDQIKSDLVKSGFSEPDVSAALDPAQYESHPALTDKPKGANLEGYLYPESFQKTAKTSPRQIIKQSLDEMHLYLTPEIREAFNRQGLTVHQGVILASLIEKEVSNDSDRSKAAQVFIKRLKSGVGLQSNATDDYSKIDASYDTYKINGLPPGPISNTTKSSLSAVAFPAQTDWLYFVSGDDGKTHFSKTLEEHQALTEKYCKKLCN